MPKFEFKPVSSKKTESPEKINPPSSKGGESVMMKVAKPEAPVNPFTKPSTISTGSSNPFLNPGKKP
jgi:hypothetical protein